MRELRLHRELYRGESVDSAVGIYARFADLSRADEGDYFVVRIEGKSEERERRIADELANYALGSTIQERR